MPYIKATLKLTAGTPEKEITISSNISTNDLERKIIEEASIFADEYDAYLPLDHVTDFLDPCFDKQDEDCAYVYYKFIDSDIFNEDNFDTMWDNYMKSMGRGR